MRALPLPPLPSTHACMATMAAHVQRTPRACCPWSCAVLHGRGMALLNQALGCHEEKACSQSRFASAQVPPCPPCLPLLRCHWFPPSRRLLFAVSNTLILFGKTRQQVCLDPSRAGHACCAYARPSAAPACQPCLLRQCAAAPWGGHNHPAPPAAVSPSHVAQTRDLLLVLMLIYLSVVLLFCTLTAHGRLPFRTVQMVRGGGAGWVDEA